MDRDIVNTVTRDRIHFWSSPMMGEGEELVFRTTLDASATGAPLHVHDEITETFAVEYGALEIDLGEGERVVLQQGQECTFAPGTPHGFRNALGSETRFITTATPGIELERFLREMYAAANAGHTNAAGQPRSLLRLAQILAPMDMTMAGAPRGVQRVLIRALACVARIVGIRSALRHPSRVARSEGARA